MPRPEPRAVGLLGLAVPGVEPWADLRRGKWLTIETERAHPIPKGAVG